MSLPGFHSKECGTQYRGCSPKCNFESRKGMVHNGIDWVSSDSDGYHEVFRAEFDTKDYLKDLEKEIMITETKEDIVNDPKHYTKGIEAIQIIDECDLGFCLGNAVKYIIRCEHKGTPNQDLAKVLWYIAHELEKRDGADFITKFCERWLKNKTTMSKVYTYTILE